jgi:hypothetical protein
LGAAGDGIQGFAYGTLSAVSLSYLPVLDVTSFKKKKKQL